MPATWIRRYPQVVYSAGPSPWGHALPWGDVTTQGDKLNLVVFDWPTDGRLFLPGLSNEITSAALLDGKGGATPVKWTQSGAWTALHLPSSPADKPASVIELRLKGSPKVDQTPAVFPNIPSPLAVEFATVTNAEKKRISWMEKFGEWKFATQAGGWKPEGKVTWDVMVAAPGDYHLELTYKGSGRTAWRIETDEGVKLQNQQNASPVYHSYPFGLLTFKQPGKHTISVSPAEGNSNKASLESIHLTPAE